MARDDDSTIQHRVPGAILVLGVALFLSLALPQLDLPGLHYDEAREAGVNAAEMLLQQPVRAFRSAGLQLGKMFLPLMVQDYVGALNIYLALPLLAVGGITVAALRLVGVLCAMATLVWVWQLGNELDGDRIHSSPGGQPQTPTGHKSSSRRASASFPGTGLVGAAAVLLLATSPGYVFWSRQGIFVTNIVVTLAVGITWAGLRWWRLRQARYLYLLAVLAGLGLWAKLLFAWVLGALAITAIGARLVARSTNQTEESTRSTGGSGASTPGQWLAAATLFVASLSPLLLFNQQTAGTLQSIFGNLGTSYYGVNNTALLQNLAVRLGQLLTLLRSDHLWYLGQPFANPAAPWIAGIVVPVALALSYRQNRNRFWMLVWLGFFCLLLVAQSSLTVSGLFITHYAVLQPFLILLVALAGGTIWQVVGRPDTTPGHLPPAGKRRPLQKAGGAMARRVTLLVTALTFLTWVGADLRADFQYHRALARTGGHADHSDASYELAAWLENRGARQPLALDWGLDAPVRFLTALRVEPLEVFGYERLDSPDPGFAARVRPFLEDPSRLYLLHTPENTVFHGRRAALEQAASALGRRVVEEATFRERSGRPLFVVVRVLSP